MAQEFQETFLEHITDDLVGNLFEGSSGSSNVITPTQDNPEDKPVDEPAKVKLPDKPIVNPVDDFTTDELIGDLLKETIETPVVEEVEIPEEDKPTKKPGRPKTPEIGFDISELYKDDLLKGYAEETPIETLKDLKALIEANKVELVEETKINTLRDYKENLPRQAQILLEYAEKGGDDFGTLLRYLGQEQKQQELNTENKDDAKEIIRQYYSLQEWSPEEINDEIEDLLDVGEDKLKKTAARFKPHLDRINQQQIDHQLEQAKEMDKRRAEARSFYVKNITDTLTKGQLGALPITKEEQKDLYSALVEERYESLGGVTNRLGALLDKIQYVEPDYQLLGKVMLLLSDPEGYDKKVLERVKKENDAQMIKKLKSVQGLGKAGDEIPQPGVSRKLKNLNSGFTNPFV